MTAEDNNTQITIIKIFAPNRANLFCLNIFGIQKKDMILILKLFENKIIIFQKNFKFKIHNQIKKILNFIPTPNRIPKI